MKKNAVERSIVWGYWLAFFTLLIIAFFSYHSSNQLRSSGVAMNHSNKVLYILSTIELTSTEMESAERGFVFYPSPKFKNTILTGETYLLELLTDLKGILKLNAQQISLIDNLSQKVDEFSRVSRTIVSIREIQGQEAAQSYFTTSESERIMAEIKHLIRQMQELESKQLLYREGMRDELIDSFNWLYLSLLSSVFIIMMILYFNIIRSIRKSYDSRL